MDKLQFLKFMSGSSLTVMDLEFMLFYIYLEKQTGLKEKITWTFPVSTEAYFLVR